MKTLTASLLALSAALLPGAAAAEKPNVLFLAVDDMNDWIGCLGTTPRAITPNLDRLAARGVSFTNAHTAGVFCAPSRAAIFSGQFASTTGCYRSARYFVNHPEIESLQMSFAKAGYETTGAGKLFHHPAGAIDVRGWSEFFLRNPSQRERGWPLDSWSEETPFPDPFPASVYNRGREITGGLFLEWGAIPDGKEEEMADTRYGEDGEELYDLKADPNEWNNLASRGEHAALVASLRKSAPATFAEPEEKLNVRRDLVIAGETFRWEKGAARPAGKTQGRPPKGRASGGRKNILFIVCDDLNTHVSPSGYGPIQTPTLDRLAADGMTFRRAFCQYPVCGPSRASFLSGLYPQSTGVLNNKVDIREERPGTITLPQFFKDKGYWTASVGKVFHSPRHEHGELAWNEFVRFDNDELPVVRRAREAFKAAHGPVDKGPNRRRWREVRKRAAAKLDAQTPPGYGRSGLRDEQHKDGKNARQVARWLEGKAYGEQPFFIACGIQKPHVPFLAPDRYFDRYPVEEITYTPDRPDLWEGLPRAAISKRYEAFGFELGVENDALRREYMQAYHACVSFIDAQLKIVFDALKASSHWEDTIVVFTSDHGYHLGDHFLWGKVTLFDIGAKVPLIVRVPGLTIGGTTSDAMVELVDIYPTLADLNGLAAPDHLQGVSLRPLLGHPERKGKKKYAYSVVTRGPQLGHALRNQRWRYGQWPDGEELYDLSADPGEKHNLAGEARFGERLVQFRDLLAAKREEAVARRGPGG